MYDKKNALLRREAQRSSIRWTPKVAGRDNTGEGGTRGRPAPCCGTGLVSW